MNARGKLGTIPFETRSEIGAGWRKGALASNRRQLGTPLENYYHHRWPPSGLAPFFPLLTDSRSKLEVDGNLETTNV
jgi:hypothetical protein